MVDLDTYRAAASRKLREALQGRSVSTDMITVREASKSMLTLVDAATNDPAGATVQSGLVVLDELMGGFAKGQLSVIAGRPSMGKSAMVLNNVVLHNARQGKRCAVFSLEVGRADVAGRLVGAMSGVPWSVVRTGKATDMGHVNHWANELAKLPIHLDDTASIGPELVALKARRVADEHEGGLDLIVVDYLQLMRCGREYERHDLEIGHITGFFCALARELDAAIILVSQLNRKVDERPDKRPRLSDLRHSGDIEQDAYSVVFVWRKGMYRMDPKNGDVTGEAVVAKNRNGRCGAVDLTWTGGRMLFGD